MYFFTFEAVPRHDSTPANEAGGAYVNCWVRAGSWIEAELKARADIGHSGWLISRKDDQEWVVAADYDDRPDLLEYYRSAVKDGACYVYHTWPLGLDEEGDDEDSRDDAQIN